MNERINITIPSDLLSRIDDAAGREHLTRSGFLRAAALERLGGGDALAAGESPVTYGLPLAPMPVDTASATSPPDRASAVALLRAFFAGREEVVAAYLIGSIARGDAGPASDIDVAVLLAEETGSGERWAIQLDLVGRIGTVFGTNEVDVVLLNDASPPLAHVAIREGVVVAGEHRAGRTAFEAQAKQRYAAYLPLARQRHDALRERIASGGFFDR